MPLAASDLDTVNYSFEVTFPRGSSTNQAGLVLAHDGDDSFYAVVLDRDAGKLALHKITDGSWGSALDDDDVTVNDNTAYVVKVIRKQRHVEARVVGQEDANITYDSSSDLGTGQSSFYSDKTDVKFDDLLAYDGSARDPMVPRIGGLAQASVSSGWLNVEVGTSGGEALVENFYDDNYMVQASVGTASTQYIWFRYHDPNNGYLVKMAFSDKIGRIVTLYRVQNGHYTQLDCDDQDNYSTPAAVKIKANGTSLKVWVDGTRKVDASERSKAVESLRLRRVCAVRRACRRGTRGPRPQAWGPDWPSRIAPPPSQTLCCPGPGQQQP